MLKCRRGARSEEGGAIVISHLFVCSFVLPFSPFNSFFRTLNSQGRFSNPQCRFSSLFVQLLPFSVLYLGAVPQKMTCYLATIYLARETNISPALTLTLTGTYE